MSFIVSIVGIYKEFGKKEVDQICACDGKPQIPGEVTMKVCYFMNAVYALICMHTIRNIDSEYSLKWC